MQTASGAFGTAVTAQDQRVAYKVTLSLNPLTVQASYQDVSNCVVSISVNESVTTSLPDGTALINGYPSAVATVSLAGPLQQNYGIAANPKQDIFWLMNPHDPTSPMFRSTRGGLPITIQAGLWDGSAAPEFITIFTGTTDSVACSNGQVTLTCRDNRSTVTSQATLPPVVIPGVIPYNRGLTSEFPIDYLLRHASPKAYYTWPAQRPSCILAVGFRTSIWPELGTIDHTSNVPVFGPGKFGTGMSGNNSFVYYDTATAVSGATFFLEFWGSRTASGFVQDATGAYFFMLSYKSDNLLHISVTTPGGTVESTVSVPVNTTHYFAAQVSWAAAGTSCTGTYWVDDTFSSFSLTALNARPTTLTMAGAGSGAAGTVEAFQVSTESVGAANSVFTPTVLMDPSLNNLTALPDVSGKDVWSILQDIAAAENAVIGFDELGVLHFRNRSTITSSSSVRSVTSSSSLLTLDSVEQMSLCATHIQVPVNALTITDPKTVWAASNVFDVDAFGTFVTTIQTNDPVANISSPDSGFFPNPSTVAGVPQWVEGLTYWRAATNADGSGSAVTVGVTVSIVQLSGTKLQLTIHNSNPFPVHLANPPGNESPIGRPSLIIGGQQITSKATALDGTTNPSSITADAQWPPGNAQSNPLFGEILLQVPANDWIQDVGSSQTLSVDLLSDLHIPKPLIRNCDIVADPRLQLLDRVTIVDPDVSQINADAMVIGIQTSLSATDWKQTIDARMWYTPGGWALGVTGKSELALTTYT